MSSAVIDANGNLLVTGGAGNDNITVNTSNPAAVAVVVNGAAQGGSPFNLSGNPNARVVVDCLGGTNIVQSSGSMPMEIKGGTGQDYLYGGSGPDVLRGGGGNNNYLSGGAGLNVLIAGQGSCSMTGGSGGAILIAGELDPSVSYDDIRSAADEWANTGDPNGPLVSNLVANTTHGVGNKTMSGGGGGDLFIHSDTDSLTNFNPGQGDAERII